MQNTLNNETILVAMQIIIALIFFIALVKFAMRHDANDSIILSSLTLRKNNGNTIDFTYYINGIHYAQYNVNTKYAKAFFDIDKLNTFVNDYFLRQYKIENASINSSTQMLSLSLQHVNAVTTTTVDFTFEHLKQKKILDIQKISKYHKRSVRIYEL
jgi:Zn-dependent oligopeptidase